MTEWDLSEVALRAWCDDVLRRYSREDIALFLIRLRKASGIGLVAVR